MNDIWHELSYFESRDLVCRNYLDRHGRVLNAAQTREVTASFIQAREYFANADRAAITVKPLLQYYGVVALSRGLVLMVSSSKKAESLKPAHGLETRDWAGTLGAGVSGIKDLTVVVRNGLFLELIRATDNTSYFRANSSAIDWKVEFPHPLVGAEFSLSDIAASLPDVASDFLVCFGSPQLSAELSALKHEKDQNQYVLTLSHAKKEVAQALFQELGEQLIFLSDEPPLTLSIPDSYHPLISQRSRAYFRIIGAVHVVPLIRNSIHLSTIALYYAASYILGMIVRYFPSTWVSLGRQEKGDAIFPLVNRFVDLIQAGYPQLILEFLKSPYKFEQEADTADA